MSQQDTERRVKRRVEWAIVEQAFRSDVVMKGDLGSREEAELWLQALLCTRRRTDQEHFMNTDGMIGRGATRVVWRYIDGWHSNTTDPEE